MWECWQDLTDTRRMGMDSRGAILPSEFQCWADLEGLSMRDRRAWWALLKTMERVFSDWKSALQAEREAERRARDNARG